MGRATRPPNLTSLGLALLDNRVGDDGAAALASLGRSRTLASLALQLTGNKVGAEGVHALAALRDAPAGRWLTLGGWGGHWSPRVLNHTRAQR